MTMPKDPNDTDDLTWEWAARLATGETISTFTATLVSGDITVGATSISGTDTIARISGGTAGVRSSIRGRMVTSTARQLDWTIRINVSEQ
jgi:thiamine monophosphate kinase